MWEKQKRADLDSLYTAARMWSVTSGVQAKAPAADAARLAKDDADKAMAWLTKAVAAGFKDRAHMEKDKDLDPPARPRRLQKATGQPAGGGPEAAGEEAVARLAGQRQTVNDQ